MRTGSILLAMLLISGAALAAPPKVLQASLPETPAGSPSADTCPEACCGIFDDPIVGTTSACSDFRIHLFDFLYGLGAWSADWDISDEGWVWVSRDRPACPRYRSVSGVVVRSKVARNDTPANHDSHDQNTVITVDPGFVSAVSDVGEDEDHSGTADSIEVEWETGIRPSEKSGDGAWPMFPKWAWPDVGDRAWVEGNWIFDCGHATNIGGTEHYRAEIHPARAIAAMRNQAHVLPGTGVTPVPVTATDLWIHGRAGFVMSQLNCGMGIIIDGVDEDHDGFGDGDPDACPTKTTPIDTNFEFVVCLPPRPSPAAQLKWSVEEAPYNTIPNAAIAPQITPITPAPALCAHDGDDGAVLYDAGTALRVAIPLAGSGKTPDDAFARHIYAGWVHPPSPPLRRFALDVNRMDLHSDTDEVPGDDGELTFFWTNLNRATDEWLRMADFDQVTCDDCQFPCPNHCNTMNDFDDDDFCCNGLQDFAGLSYDFYVRNGQSFTLRAQGYDQDCYDDSYGDHDLSLLMYAGCYTLDLDEFGNNDDLTSLPSVLDPEATTFGPPDYGVGNHDSPARKIILVPNPPNPPSMLIVSDYELEYSIAEVPLADEDKADLSVTKVCGHSGPLLLVGQPLECTITVANPGPGLPRSVVVSDTVSDGLTPARFTLGVPQVRIGSCPVTTPCSVSAAGFSCPIDTIPVGASAVITVTITPGAPGTLTDQAHVATASIDAQSANDDASSSTLVYCQTATTYTGSTTGDYHDPTTASARLACGPDPLPGKTIGFLLGGVDSCSAATGATGSASCSLVPTLRPDTYSMVASFAGSGLYLASSDTKPFVVTQEQTQLTYNGVFVALRNKPIVLKGKLLEDDGSPAGPGRLVNFRLVTQQCNGTTDATGSASCTLVVNQPAGAKSLVLTFAGDAYYVGSTLRVTMTVQ